MKYINILSLICDTDTQTTVDFREIWCDLSSFIIPKNKLNDDPIVQKIYNGKFIVLSLDDENVVLQYFYNGTRSIKSCTKKVELKFANNTKNKIQYKLLPDKPTDIRNDEPHKQLLMTATIYTLTRDKVDFNQVNEKQEYKLYYYLRKLKSDEFVLDTRISKSINIDNISNIEILKLTKINNPHKLLLDNISKYGIDDFHIRF